MAAGAAITLFPDMSTLWRFQFSTAVCYTIEVTDLTFRFYVTGGRVETTAGVVEVTHPYAEADIAALKPKQINDVIYIVHPDYPVGKLSRVTNTSWTYEVVVFDQPAMLDENTTAITIEPSHAFTSPITLTASDDIFDPLHVGSFWRIGFKRQTGSISLAINANIESNGYVIFGTFNVRTYGIWTADVVLQKRAEDDTWEEVKRWIGQDDRNIDAEGEALEAVEYRLVIENYVSNTNGRAVLEWDDAIIYGLVEITAVGSGTSATADVIENLYSEPGMAAYLEPTVYWQEGAWSDYRGYPRAVTVHQQRLVFGGTASNPATIWGSVVGDFENFLRGTDADDSYAYQLAGLELNAIQWLVSQRELVVGTTGAEWTASDLNPNQTPRFRQQSAYGSEYVDAIAINEVILFVERKGRKLRELVYSFEQEQFIAADLALLSENITAGGIVQMAWQGDLRILWVVTGDGRLSALTYDREQQVIGWHEHPMDGDVISVQTVYGESDADDEVWIIAEHLIGSTTAQYVERLNPIQWTALEDAFYVDCGLTYEGSPETDFTGAEHLAGRDVVGLADGVPFATTVDVEGNFSLPSGVAASSKVHVGLAFTSEMSPFRLDVDSLAGIYPAKIRRVESLHVRLLNTAGGYYKTPDDATAKELEVAEDELFSGDKQTGFKSGHEYDPEIIIRQSDPLPMTIQALIVGVEVSST